MRRIPALKEDEIVKILRANGIDRSPYVGKVAIVAIRGYYLDSMGVPGVNDRQIYDDSMFVWSPAGMVSYQANTDPNGYRKGHGTGSAKGMAMLKTGIHLYGKGLHKRVAAFRQTEPFTVIRDGDPPYEDTGWHAIDLHSGGYVSTSSLGCQTVPAGTWPEFKSLVYGWLDEFENPFRRNDWNENVRSFPYVLVEETKRRAGDLVVSSRYLA